MSLEETFQFKVRRFPAHCNVLPQNYNTDISLKGPNNLKLQIYWSFRQPVSNHAAEKARDYVHYSAELCKIVIKYCK